MKLAYTHTEQTHYFKNEKGKVFRLHPTKGWQEWVEAGAGWYENIWPDIASSDAWEAAAKDAERQLDEIPK